MDWSTSQPPARRHRPFQPGHGRSVARVELLEDRTAPAATWLVDTIADSGAGSLRWAVEQANASAEADIIRFDSTVFGSAQTIALASGELRVWQDVLYPITIEGTGQGLLTISGNSVSRVFHVTTSAMLNLSDLTISNGLVTGTDAAPNGGGIRNYQGSLTLTRVTLIGNDAFNGGGGLYNFEASATISESTFVNNSAQRGSAIYNESATATKSSSVTIGNSSILNNQASDAGTLYNAGLDSTAVISDCNISGNTTFNGGGGTVNTDKATLTVTNSQFANNEATSVGFGHGGALVNRQQGTLTIDRSVISGNVARLAGGGVFNSNGTLNITASRITGNRSLTTGGGLYSVLSTVAIDRSTFDANEAVTGGAYYTASLGTTSIRNSTFSGNRATADGAGIYIGPNGGTIDLVNCTISDNRVSYLYGAGYGGGMFVESGAVSLANTIVAGNWKGIASVPAAPDDIRGAVVGSYNLIGNGNGMTGLTDGLSGNQIGATLNSIDARLAPLADNGGSTPTHALLPNSPAQDHGDPAFEPDAFTPPLTTDQRGAGFPRVFGAALDIGAFEDQGGPKLVIQSISANPSAVAEGDLATISGTFTVDDPQLAYVVAIQWGDGSSTGFELAQDDRSFSANHRYVDNPPGQPNGAFTARVSIAAADMLDIRSVAVQVHNVAPTFESVSIPDTLVAGVATEFSASAFDPGQDTLTYYWDFGDGGSGSEGGGTAVGQTVTYAFANPGDYHVTVSVFDDDFATALGQGNVVVVPANYPPVANAGPDQQVSIGATVSISGSTSSDLDGDPLTFTWSLTAVPIGSIASLSDTAVVAPTFVADLPGTYMVQLVVHDGVADSTPDTVRIDAQNSPPVARPGGPYVILVGSNLTLDGTASDDPDDFAGDQIVSFAWELNNDGVFDDAVGAAPTIPWSMLAGLPQPDIANPVHLRVTDTFGATHTSSTTLTITVNHPPVAVITGSSQVVEGSLLTLDGSHSIDLDIGLGDQIISYVWDLDYDGSTFNNDVVGIVANVPSADNGPSRTVALRVTDTFGASDVASFTLQVTNAPPVVSVQNDTFAEAGYSFDLAGNTFTDAGVLDTHTATIDWGDGTIQPGQVVYGGAGAGEVHGSHTYQTSGIFTVRITVTDDDGDSDADIFQVTALTLPRPDLTTVLFAPDLAEPGDFIDSAMSLAVSNQGNGAAGPFTIGIYLSSDPLITTPSMLLARVSLSGLAAITSTNVNLQFTDVRIPAATPYGSYYLHAIADDQYGVTESNEANNSSVRPITINIKPDLRINAPPAYEGVWYTGQHVSGTTLGWKVVNSKASAAGPFHVGAYLSTDATITTADIPLADGTVLFAGLPGNQQVAVIFPPNVAVPDNIPPGDYYFGLIADVHTRAPNPPWGEVDEHDESNNTDHVGQVTITGPDLIVSSFQFDRNAVGPGQQVGEQIHLQIRNTASQADAVVPFNVRLVISPDLVFTPDDMPLVGATAVVNPLPHGTTVDVSFPATVSIPAGLAPGQYFLGALVDVDNSVAEENELNNVSSLPVPVIVTNNTWTILAYLNGDNNLEAGIMGTLNQLEMVNTANSPITILAMVDRIPGYSDVASDYTETRRGVVAYDGKKFNWLIPWFSSPLNPVANPTVPGSTELNMGDPRTLTDFLAWGTQYAPAQHYELIVQGHGDRRGFGPDETNGDDYMLGKELRAALSASPFIDLLALEACEMQAIEIATELIGEVGYAYGSPTVRFIHGNLATVGDPYGYYENGLNWLVAHPSATPRQLAEQTLALDQLGGFVVPSSHPQFVGLTLVSSVIDVGSMAVLNAKIDAFNQFALSSATPLDWLALRQARVDYTTSYEFSELRDIGDYFKAVYSVFANSFVPLSPAIRDAARAVVDQLDNVMVGQKGLSNSRVGMSIYFPESPNGVGGGYNGNKFTFLDTKDPNGTHWREFLLKLPAPPLQLQPIVATIIPGQTQTPTNAVPAGAAGQPAFFEGTIETPEQVNFFTFNGSAGQVLYAVAEGEHIGTLYPVLTVYGPDGQAVLAQVVVTNAANVANISGLVLPETGTYYVVVSSAGNLDPLNPVPGNSTGRYFLAITFGDAAQVAPRLQVDPTIMDFGIIQPGTQTARTLRLTNTGGTTLTITDLNFPAPFHDPGILLPLQLGPGEWFDLPIIADATVVGRWSGTLHILSDDPNQPDQTVFQTVQAAEKTAFGTNRGDVLRIRPVPGQLGTVVVNRVVRRNRRLVEVPIQVFAPHERIIVYALGGNDVVEVRGNVTRSVFIFGGAGHDRLVGGRGNDLLVGGAGSDVLIGGAGNDVLIGGSGRDLLIGGSAAFRARPQLAAADENILIGDRTIYDANDQALLALLNEWSSTETMAARIAGIRQAATGAPARIATVDDAAVDFLFSGRRSADWFWQLSRDLLVRRAKGDWLN